MLTCMPVQDQTILQILAKSYLNYTCVLHKCRIKQLAILGQLKNDQIQY